MGHPELSVCLFTFLAWSSAIQFNEPELNLQKCKCAQRVWGMVLLPRHMTASRGFPLLLVAFLPGVGMVELKLVSALIVYTLDSHCCQIEFSAVAAKCSLPRMSQSIVVSSCPSVLLLYRSISCALSTNLPIASSLG